MKIELTLSENAAETIRTLKLRGETNAECVDRLISNLLAISLDKDNYEQHFGPQVRQARRRELLAICVCGHWQHLHVGGVCATCGCVKYRLAAR